ncbi:MAG: leucine-rich repeat domain-containing protein [Clostridia bacterium]|nr:leucine-rich repeat domain-containing protein [Clostridia bacterium]
MKKLISIMCLLFAIVCLIASCEHVHYFDDWETIKQPTCTENGDKVRYCTCGEKQSDIIIAIGHKYVDGVCENCGDENLPDNPVLPDKPVCQHTEVEILTAVEPTCTKTGLTEGKQCSICNEVLVVQTELPVVSHTYSDDLDATCNICSFTREVDCAHIEVTTLPAKDPTCTEAGATEGIVCSKCQEILQPQMVVPAKGHTEVIDAAVEATCTTAGKTEGKHCSNCNEVLIAQGYIKVLGHNESDWIVEKAPTDVEDGYKYKQCYRCGEKTSEEVISALSDIGLAYETIGSECSITGIGSFSGTELTIPEYIKGNKVTAIGEAAFSNCAQLTKIVIPESVEFIGDRAFYGCAGITEITIPSSVTDIGTQIFYKADNLHTVYYNSPYSKYTTNDIYYSSKKTNVNTFLSNGSIKKVVFGGKKVPDSILNGCSGITEVVITDSVTEIGDGAFEECKSITSITLGNNLEVIGSYSLSKTSITEIVIPDSVKRILSGAFSDCEALVDIHIGKGLNFVGNYNFLYCYSLTNVYITDLAAWCAIEYSSYLPEANGYGNPLERAGNLYINGVLAENLVIGNDVKEINNAAFAGCKSLKTLVIEQGVKSIGESCFKRCENLESVIIPTSVSNIGKTAFYGCSSLTEVEIPDSITNIRSGMFEYCSNLISVTIPDSVNSIESSAFDGCSSLEFITIPESVSSIGNYAFKGCTSLEFISIPDSVTIIGNEVFEYCSSLSNIKIGKVTSIGSYAFYGCDTLATVYFKGTEAEWNDIEIASSNSCFTNASVYFYSEDVPLDLGNFWHYVDGVPTIWPDYSIGLEFISNGNGTCYLNGMGSCTDTVVRIPPTSPNGDIVTEVGCPIDPILGNVMNSNYGSFASDVTIVRIPYTVKTVNYAIWFGARNITRIVVDEANTYFKTVDGNLYSKGGTYLIRYAPAQPHQSYVIESTVDTIGMYAFLYCDNITSVIFENPYSWCFSQSMDLYYGSLISDKEMKNPETAAEYLKSTYCNKFLIIY